MHGSGTERQPREGRASAAGRGVVARVCVLYLKPDRSAGWTCEVRDKGHDFIELTFVSAV
jgi:hypothetical protein